MVIVFTWWRYCYLISCNSDFCRVISIIPSGWSVFSFLFLEYLQQVIKSVWPGLSQVSFSLGGVGVWHWFSYSLGSATVSPFVLSSMFAGYFF